MCLAGAGVVLLSGAPAGQGIITRVAYNAAARRPADVLPPVVTAFVSLVTLGISALAVTLGALALGAAAVSYVAGNRQPDPSMVAAATAALPITMLAVVMGLQPTAVAAAAALSGMAVNKDAPPANGRAELTAPRPTRVAWLEMAY